MTNSYLALLRDNGQPISSGPFVQMNAGRRAVSVSLRGKRRLSDADVERARLLHQYALHRASADAQRLPDLQYARAALVEAGRGYGTRAVIFS